MRAKEFVVVVGLGNVIVGTVFQAQDAIDTFAARSEHDDRDCGALAQFLNRSKPFILGSMTS